MQSAETVTFASPPAASAAVIPPAQASGVRTVDLTPAEATDTAVAADAALAACKGLCSVELITRAQQLPGRLRHALAGYRLAERESLLLLRGLPVVDAELGPTPSAVLEGTGRRHVDQLETILVLIACLLGDPVCWDAQQQAALIHDVVPVPGDEWRQTSSASLNELSLHTEDAFHPYRADYLGLLCLRNPDAVPTTYVCVADLELSPGAVRTLREPRFLIRPDESHEVADGAPVPPVPLLFGAADAPYLRVDPDYTRSAPGDPEAARSLDELFGALREHTRAVALRAGDLLFIDNFRAVHGRRSFAARHDGSDRWLKRVNVVRDLRKSRAVRKSPADPVIPSRVATEA